MSMGKHPYADILGMERPVSKKHPPMSMEDRAAQFSPFAALTGYDDAVRETARLTDARVDLDEEALLQLDRRMQRLAECLADGPDVTLTVFVPDGRKEGGAYETISGRVKRIDACARAIVMEGGERVAMDDVTDIAGEIFAEKE